MPPRAAFPTFRLFLCLLASLAAPACATPDVAAAPVTQLLQERGLIPAEATADATAPPPASDQGLMSQVRHKASELVMTAMNFLGVPYRRGGNTAEEGFDCSGFTRHIFEQSLGLVLPRRADEQARAPGLLQVRRDELKPGDLVFFNTLRRTFSHVGIYVGDGKFIHSPRAGAEIRIEDMRVAYWRKRFTGARRPAALAEPAPPAPEWTALDLHQP
ncbi:C40 family peptidase [Caldimonas thermodepolymerans]|jgi:Cell wall-associated hydrolases (invasion-associated proteins)|uniref:C40 family peptidase n=1 Tax=Caldimonas thermodepolymerans TaxID=215580 RepID=UPI0024902E31|nr:C40 family peptidase [Caldimonas thermodepolymerans]